MKICKISAGEKVGEMIELVREKQLAGELKTVKEAKEFLRKRQKNDYMQGNKELT